MTTLALVIITVAVVLAYCRKCWQVAALRREVAILVAKLIERQNRCRTLQADLTRLRTLHARYLRDIERMEAANWLLERKWGQFGIRRWERRGYRPLAGVWRVRGAR